LSIEAARIPVTVGAAARHAGAGRSSHYRPVSMGLIDRDGTPALALDRFQAHTARMGIMQWFHLQDPRLGDAVAPPNARDAADLRTGDSRSDRRMVALASETPSAFRFTPESEGLRPHHTRTPKDPMHLADTRARMIVRPAPPRLHKAVA
jgi:hypothetical protein